MEEAVHIQPHQFMLHSRFSLETLSPVAQSFDGGSLACDLRWDTLK